MADPEISVSNPFYSAYSGTDLEYALGMAPILAARKADKDGSNLDVGSISLVSLATDVIAAIGGGNDPANFLGNVSALSDDLEDPATSSGKWYFVEGVSGTMTGTNPPSSSVEDGGYIYSNGAAWLVRAASPSVLADGQIAKAKLSTALQGGASEVDDSYTGAWKLMDKSGRLLLEVDSTGKVQCDLDFSSVDAMEEGNESEFVIEDLSGKVLLKFDATGALVWPLLATPSDVSAAIAANVSLSNLDSSKIDLATINATIGATPIDFSTTAVGDSGATSVLTDTGFTHPSVLHIPGGWNGAKYWCALTPYPGTDAQYENPTIYTSADGITWAEPSGISNPIVSSPSGSDYNSDTELVLGPDGWLYCFYRASEGGQRRFKYVKSRDGINWSTPATLIAYSIGVADLLSPSLVYDNGWHMFAVNMLAPTATGEYYTNYAIERYYSPDLVTWSTPEIVSVSGRPWGTSQEPWHLAIRKVGAAWLMLLCTCNNGTSGSSGQLFFGKSGSGWSWNFQDSAYGGLSSAYRSCFNVTSINNDSLGLSILRASTASGWQIFQDTATFNLSE